MSQINLSNRYDIWLVTYATYAIVEVEGNKPPVLVERNLSFDVAKQQLVELGFGYCMKPVI